MSGALIGDGTDRTGLFIGYLVGAGIMIIGGVVEWLIGINAEGKSLEAVTKPLTAVDAEPGDGVTTSTGSVDEVRFRGQPAVRVAAGELAATFLPDLGMTGVSLRCRGREHLALPGGLAALRAGATLGLPLLAPWANRLASRRYRAAGVDVDLDGLPLGTDANGLPIHGLLVGRPGWRLGRRSARGGRGRLPRLDRRRRPGVPVPAPHRGRRRRPRPPADARHDGHPDRSPPGAGGLRLASVPAPAGYAPQPLAPAAAGRAPTSPRRPGHPDGRRAGRGGPKPNRSAAARSTTCTASAGTPPRAGGRRRASISMRAGTGYPYAQVWVPAGRPFAALEPMTAPTNSLVDGTAPLVEPGDAFTAAFTLDVGGTSDDEGTSTMSTPITHALGRDRRRRLRRRGVRQAARQARRRRHPARPPQLPPVPAAPVPGGHGRAVDQRHRPPAAGHLQQGRDRGGQAARP